MGNIQKMKNRISDFLYGFWHSFKNMGALKRLGMIFVLFLITGFLGASYLYYQSLQLPAIDALVEYEPRVVTSVYDKNDKVLAEFSTEQRIELKEDEIPKILKQA